MSRPVKRPRKEQVVECELYIGGELVDISKPPPPHLADIVDELGYRSRLALP